MITCAIYYIVISIHFYIYTSKELNVMDSGMVVLVTTILKSYPRLPILYRPGIT